MNHLRQLSSLIILALLCCGQTYANTNETTPQENTEHECHANEVDLGYVCVDDDAPGEQNNNDNETDDTNTNDNNNTDDNPGDNTNIIISSTVASMVGNPVSLITGNKYQKEVDYQSPSSKLQFIRHYNSKNASSNHGLGQGWTSSVGATIREYEGQGYAIVQGTGSTRYFFNPHEDENGNTIYLSDNPDAGSVRNIGNEYIWQIPDGRSLKFRGSYLYRIDFPGKAYLDFNYRRGRIAEVKNEHGSVLLLDYYPAGLPVFSSEPYRSAPGLLKSVTLPNGQVQEYLYDGQQNLTRVQYADGTQRTYHYENPDHPNHLTGITNRNGVRYASWTYDNVGRAISSKHANDVESVNIEYFPSDPVTGIGSTQVTNSLDQINTYEWRIEADTGEMLLLSSSGPGCATCPRPNMRYTYNSANQVETATKVTSNTASGSFTFDYNDQQLNGLRQKRYVYDDLGRLLEIHETNSNGDSRLVSRREYTGTQRRASRIFRPSVNTGAEYSVETLYTADNLIKQVIERGYVPTDETLLSFNLVERSTTMQYSDGVIQSIDGPRTDVDDITYFEYDNAGRLSGVKLPTGRHLLLSQYDADGRPKQFQIGNRTPLRIQYDANGNVSQISMHEESVRYEHDAESQLGAMIDPYGRRQAFDYDQAGRLTRATDHMGLSVEYLKDTENRVTQRSFFGLDGSLVKSINYVFDAENRLQSKHEQTSNYSTDSQINSEKFLEYDELSRLVNVTGQDGAAVRLDYDAEGNIRELTESGVPSAQFEYDPAGRLIAETDARGNRTQRVIDDFGRVVVLLSTDSGISRYRYDLAGNRTWLQNAEGEVTEYEWDVGNRLTRVTNIDGTTSFEYHAENGRLVKTTNPSSTETFEYDDNAQLTKHTRQLGSFEFTTSVTYNRRGQVDKKMLPDGQALRYHYYDNGVNAGTLRAITRESAFGLMQNTLVGEIDLEPRDGQTGYLSHNGVRTQRQYHPDGSIKSIEVSDTLSLQYTFDDMGNISGIDENGADQQYIYNGRKLVLANTLSGEYAYDYDQVGNRVASYEVANGQAAVETEYRYSDEGSGNRLVSTTNVDTGDTNEYDYNAAGAALKAGAEFSYTYNAKQRPIEVYKSGELLAEYRYNSFGERIQKTVHTNGATESTYYLYDGHNLVGEIDDNGQVKSQYVYLQNRYPVVKLERGQTYAIHTDHLGTPRKLTDDQSKLVWDANYTPFGKATETIAKVEMKLRFPGQYEDTETGTHYNYYRDYDPGTGRYITSDPLGLQAGVNTYAYANANPVLGSDVLGLEDDVNDDNIIDKVKEFVSEVGQEGMDKAIEVAMGKNFVAVATQTLQQIPGEFSKLAANDPKYENLPVETLKPLFEESYAVDMAYTFAVLFTLKKGSKLLGKTSLASVVAHKLFSKLVNYGMRAYLVAQFGEAAGEFFDNIDQLADKIEDVAENDDYTCADTEEIAAEIARMLADVALHSADNLANFFSKVRMKNPKNKNKCSEPDTREEHKECYKSVNGFNGLNLTPAQINRLERELGGAKSDFCETK